MIKFKGKVRKIGNSYGILIRKAFVETELLALGQKVTIVADDQSQEIDPSQEIIYTLWYSNTHNPLYSLASA